MTVEGVLWVVIDPDKPNALEQARQMLEEWRHSFIRRPVRPDESVHHIDGVRDDNRPENLRLRQGNHGNGVVYTCADCGFHNVQARD
jgi:HNH endonuclease